MLESNIFALKWERTLMRFPRMEMPLPPTDLYKVIYLLRGIANWLGVARSVYLKQFLWQFQQNKIESQSQTARK